MQAFAYAQECGVNKMGVSLSDPTAFGPVAEVAILEVLQFPHNLLTPYDPQLLSHGKKLGKQLIINRPFGMGALALKTQAEKVEAFRFIHQTVNDGIVLTGTKSPAHLQENIELFKS